MKKHKLLFLFIMLLSVFYASGQNTDGFLDEFPNRSKSQIEKIGYKFENENIVIDLKPYSIAIDTARQMLVIKQNGTVLTEEKTRHTFDKRFLSGVYLLSLPQEASPCVLISSYIVGATGYSANITHGLFINLNRKNPLVQTLSTWGLVEKNFFDIKDSMFLCINLQFLDERKILVPNYFVLSKAGVFEKHSPKIKKHKCYVIHENKWETLEHHKKHLLPKPDIL